MPACGRVKPGCDALAFVKELLAEARGSFYRASRSPSSCFSNFFRRPALPVRNRPLGSIPLYAREIEELVLWKNSPCRCREGGFKQNWGGRQQGFCLFSKMYLNIPNILLFNYHTLLPSPMGATPSLSLTVMKYAYTNRMLSLFRLLSSLYPSLCSTATQPTIILPGLIYIW